MLGSRKCTPSPWAMAMGRRIYGCQILHYKSSDLQRVDLFITPGIEDSFSELMQNFAFLPQKLMAWFLAQNGSD